MALYVDESGRKTWTRVVYVVDLDPAACNEYGTACEGDCAHRPVYVGETALEPAERFDQHKSGVKASKWVKHFGIGLNEDLMTDAEYETTESSELAEAVTAALLRQAGYCVFGGH